MGNARARQALPRRTFWKETIDSLIFVEIDYGTGRTGPSRRLMRTDETDGQFVGSLCENGAHAPALDVDLPIEASTAPSGRTNLTFRTEVPKDACLRLLIALRDASLIAPSWARANYGRLSTRQANFLVPSFEVKVPMRALPSSTDGHFHLYFDAEVTAAAHETLLDAFEGAGLIGGDFRALAKRNGTTLLVKPGLRKRDLRAMAPERRWENDF